MSIFDLAGVCGSLYVLSFLGSSGQKQTSIGYTLLKLRRYCFCHQVPLFFPVRHYYCNYTKDCQDYMEYER